MRGVQRMPLDVDAEQPSEQLNHKAVTATSRVRQKLTGRDFNPIEALDVPDQVNRLILQATSHENLCQMYIGWYVAPFICLSSVCVYVNMTCV